MIELIKIDERNLTKSNESHQTMMHPNESHFKLNEPNYAINRNNLTSNCNQIQGIEQDTSQMTLLLTIIQTYQIKILAVKYEYIRNYLTVN